MPWKMLLLEVYNFHQGISDLYNIDLMPHLDIIYYIQNDVLNLNLITEYKQILLSVDYPSVRIR